MFHWATHPFCLQGFQPGGGNLGYLCFSGKISALPKVKPMSADPEHNICGTSVASQKPPVLGPDLGVRETYPKTKRGGFTGWLLGRLDFRGRWDLVKSEKWSQCSDFLFEVSIKIEVKHFELSHLKWRNICPVPVITIFFGSTQSYYKTWKDKIWIFVTLGPKKVIQSPKVERTSSILAFGNGYRYTLTWLAGKSPIFNRIHTSWNGWFSIVMLAFLGVDGGWLALFSWIIWGFFWEVWSELFQRPRPVCWGNFQQVAIVPICCPWRAVTINFTKSMVLQFVWMFCFLSLWTLNISV